MFWELAAIACIANLKLLLIYKIPCNIYADKFKVYFHSDETQFETQSWLETI